MTREETIKALRDALDSVDITFPYRLTLVEAIEHLSFSEPQGLDEVAEEDWYEKYKEDVDAVRGSSCYNENELDEAAEKCESYYDVGDEQGYLYTHKGDIADAFKAGANWAAERPYLKGMEISKKSPFTGGDVLLLTRKEELEYRGEKVTINRQYYKCADTGREFTDGKLDDDMMWAVFRAYCEKKGFQTFGDILPEEKQPSSTN